MLQLGESLSLQILELSSGWQTEERVQGVAINVEGSHTSWSCNDNLMLQEKMETVDKVRLSCAGCARDNHSQRWGTVGCVVLLDSGIPLQLYISPVGWQGWLWW